MLQDGDSDDDISSRQIETSEDKVLQLVAKDNIGSNPKKLDEERA